MLAPISRFVGRRLGAVTLALALSSSLGVEATAAAAPAKSTAAKSAPAKSAPAKSAPAKDASPQVPEPPAATPKPGGEATAIEVMLPLEVKGKLSKESRQELAERLKVAAAATKVSGGPYRARLALRLSNKRDYAFTLTLLGSDGATAAEATDACKACSLDEAAARIDPLVGKAAAGLVKEPPPPAPAEVSVSSQPPGARVRIDGVERGPTPQVLELPPGEHTVLVDKPGFLEHSQTLTVEPGVAQKLDITLAAQPPPAKGSKRSKGAKSPKGAPAPAGPGAGRGLKIGGAVVLGLGVAGVLTGVAMILIDEDPMPLKCSGAAVDFRGVCRYRYDTLMGGIIGVAAGGLGVGGGLAMMIKGHQIAVRARAGKQQATLGLVVRW